MPFYAHVLSINDNGEVFSVGRVVRGVLTLSLPYDKVEPGETPAETVRRATLEQTGINLPPRTLSIAYTEEAGKDIHIVYYIDYLNLTEKFKSTPEMYASWVNMRELTRNSGALNDLYLRTLQYVGY